MIICPIVYVFFAHPLNSLDMIVIVLFVLTFLEIKKTGDYLVIEKIIDKVLSHPLSVVPSSFSLVL